MVLSVETVFLKAKKWGNSVGVILPKELEVKPDDEVLVKVTKVEKHGKAGAAWGLFKKKADTQAILDELKED